MHRILVATWLAIGLTVAFACGAQGATPLTDFWSISFTDEGGEAGVQLCIPNMEDVLASNELLSKTWGDPTEQNPSEYLPIGESDAVLRWLTMEVNPDPVLSLFFSVQAGPSGSVFTFSMPAAPPLTFPVIDAVGTASAGVTVTDTDGDGATATGQETGSNFFEAKCNGGSFALLIGSPVSTGSYGSSKASDAKPWTYIGPTTSMQSEFKFHLTANDILGATSVFVVVPEPVTTATLAVGLFSLLGARYLRKK